MKLEPIAFGLILILIWMTLTLRRLVLLAPSNLESLQRNIVLAIDHASARTALLTAGLISIAFGLA